MTAGRFNDLSAIMLKMAGGRSDVRCQVVRGLVGFRLGLLQERGAYFRQLIS